MRFRTCLSGIYFFVLSTLLALPHPADAGDASRRPNILFCLADDWQWPHAGAYGDRVVQTPAFDRLAREGVLFDNAFVTAPSCTPSRNSILTGQWHWRLGQGVNLWSTLDPKHPVFPLLLEEAGYCVGHCRKAWGPGDFKALGRDRDPAGPVFKDLADFLGKRPGGKPFCFWLGTSDPHRPYQWQSGAQSGIDIQKIKLPADLPDHETIRTDVADYYFEVQRWDRDVADALAMLEQAAELENTIVVMSGDNGMPFPRHKTNLYDSGTHTPLAIRWGARAQGGRTVKDFVSLSDLAPTFLEAAGLTVPEQMTGRSLIKVLLSAKSGQVDPARDHVLTGRERHVPAQEVPSTAGYPMRAIRTHEFLYIRNFQPDRWPAGAPQNASFGNRYADCDDGPSKTFVLEHRDDPKYARYFKLAFVKRPAEELYDLKADPDQLENVADQARLAPIKAELAGRLMAELKATGDPRVTGGGDEIDSYPYYGQTKTREPVVLQLDSPQDYQVVQRRSRRDGIIRVSGRAPAGTEKLEVQIGGDWLPLEFSKARGVFDAEVRIPAGGWQVFRARARAKGKLLASTEVQHVGAGEVFVVAGQSNSANHGEEKLSTKTGLVAAFDGRRWQLARDPQPGASGNGGSFMPPFGDAIAERFKVPVGIVACGIGATSVREWLPKGTKFPNPPTLVGRVQQLPGGEWESTGDAYATFTARMKQLGPRGFRAVLWHQGESDANQKDPIRTLPGPLYRQYLEQLIRDSRREIGWQAPWFVALVSYHVPGDEASPDIRAAQKSLWETGIALEGPDSDALKAKLRERDGQGVHFSGPGLRQHAARWAEKVAPWLEAQLNP